MSGYLEVAPGEVAPRPWPWRSALAAAALVVLGGLALCVAPKRKGSLQLAQER